MRLPIKWLIVLLASLNFGFMAFDGIRAFTTGDYIRPESGEYAGQLGPWSEVVDWVGIDPESGLMKSIFVLWGLSGLFLTMAFVLNYKWAKNGLLIVSAASLWYLMPGTILSALQIILLLIFKKLK